MNPEVVHINATFLTRYLWVLIITCIFSVLSLYLNVKYIKDITNHIERVRLALDEEAAAHSRSVEERKLTIDDINERNTIGT